MSRHSKRSKIDQRRGLALGAVGLAAILLATPASAVDIPSVAAPAAGPASVGQSDTAAAIQVRARGGSGVHSGGGVRSGGFGVRSGGHFRGGHNFGRGIGVPLLIAPAIGYGAYSYYNDDYSDCRSVRVKLRRCWVDDDGDRECGVRWVWRRICD